MLAVLRVWGPMLDVDGGLRAFSHKNVQQVWRVGEVDRRGRVQSSSGFTILLCESESEQQIVERAANELAALAISVAEMTSSGARAQVDFALFVPSSEPRSITFESAVLQAMAQVGVSIVVSAYPSSDAEEDGE